MRLIFLFILFLSTLSAGDIHFNLDNDSSRKYQAELYILKKTFNQNEGLLKKYNSGKVLYFSELSKLQNNLNLLNSIRKIVSKKYHNDDLIVIVSSMDYVNKRAGINFHKKIYNDGWITSPYSPLKKEILDKYGKPLNGVKIIIIDPYQNVEYAIKRARFFSYFFQKLGAKLLYYGSLDGDIYRLPYYIRQDKDLMQRYHFKPLLNQKIIKIDDKVIRKKLD